jgi:hypothetical protein
MVSFFHSIQVIDVFHPNSSGVSKAKLAEKLAANYNVCAV